MAVVFSVLWGTSLASSTLWRDKALWQTCLQIDVFVSNAGFDIACMCTLFLFYVTLVLILVIRVRRHTIAQFFLWRSRFTVPTRASIC